MMTSELHICCRQGRSLMMCGWSRGSMLQECTPACNVGTVLSLCWWCVAWHCPLSVDVWLVKRNYAAGMYTYLYCGHCPLSLSLSECVCVCINLSLFLSLYTYVCIPMCIALCQTISLSICSCIAWTFGSSVCVCLLLIFWCSVRLWWYDVFHYLTFALH